MQQVPKLIFGDSKHSTVDQAQKMGLGEEWVYGDPMAQELNAIVFNLTAQPISNY